MTAATAAAAHLGAAVEGVGEPGGRVVVLLVKPRDVWGPELAGVLAPLVKICIQLKEEGEKTEGVTRCERPLAVS